MLNIQGSLLVASPHLPDPNFYRTVVLMIEHSDDGALGVILNRISDTPLRRVWESVCNSECVSNEHLFVGGPVEGPLMALHRDMNLEGVEILPGLFFTSEREVLEQLVEAPADRFRIFSGYSGWSAGQLDAELKMGGWLTTSANANQILGDFEELWRDVTHSIGAEITDRALGIRHIPVDPRSN